MVNCAVMVHRAKQTFNEISTKQLTHSKPAALGATGGLGPRADACFAQLVILPWCLVKKLELNIKNIVKFQF